MAPNNLPAQLTSFIGREQVLGEVQELLARARLITLTGPPGTGKTRLALQLAERISDRFPGGVFWVPLSAISDQRLVISTVARTVGIDRPGREPLESLKSYLREKRLLLVLDNFEQILAAGPELAELLAACESVVMLVTSRVALRLSGEHEFRVPPLTLPASGTTVPAQGDPLAFSERYEAVQLFVERARAVKADLAVTEENLASIVEVSRLLDGLPLAIELAAVRVRLLPPQALLPRLRGVTGRSPLQFLTAGARNLPARQQTLRNTIDWSYRLLNAAEQALLRRVSVFAGSCSLDAAEAVLTQPAVQADMLDRSSGAEQAADLSPEQVLDGMDALVAKSLLQTAHAADGAPRVGMLRMIREYALEQLASAGELQGMRRRHAEYYLELAEEAEPYLRGQEQAAWLDRLEAEHDNLRAALEWTQTEAADPDLGLRLAGSLTWFWEVRGHATEGRRWLAKALARGSSHSPAQMKALYGAGWMAHYQRDAETARSLLHESLAIASQLDDQWATAWTLHLLGRVEYYEGNSPGARALGRESLRVARSVGDGWLMAWALHLLGLAAHIEADYREARVFYQQSLEIRRELGYQEGVGTVLVLMAMAASSGGEHTMALRESRESLVILRRLGALNLLVNALPCSAVLAAAFGQHERAVRIAAGASVLGESIDVIPIPLIEAALNNALRSARASLGEAAYTAADDVGRSMSLEETIAEALAVEETTEQVHLSQTQQPGGSQSVAGLTARELEVLRLIAAGRTSKQIAAELVVSIPTVERHITHIYGKIGARGRAEATAFALTHRVV